ncbi:hypothetical protein HDV03_000292 [Kappamyces sp. JEL0829]|nr:hypothetical protein HDV03_000292 [Kappamyces sp. JEL0829]
MSEWTCRHCTLSNPGHANRCDICLAPKPTSVRADVPGARPSKRRASGARAADERYPSDGNKGGARWACDSCILVNEAGRSVCGLCGQPRQQKRRKQDRKQSDEVIEISSDGEEAKHSERPAAGPGIPKEPSAAAQEPKGKQRADTVPIRLFLASPVSASRPAQQLPDPDSFAGLVSMTPVVNSGRCIGIKELVQPHLKIAICSAYVLDDQWLLDIFPKDTPLLFCTQKPKGVPILTSVLAVSPFLTFIFPPLKGEYGCMHIKLMIMIYDTHVRVVVPSANLIDYDWSKIENILFYQDFRRLGSQRDQSLQCPFWSELSSLLGIMKIPPRLIELLGTFDYSTARGRLVVSRPGHSQPLDPQKYGQLAIKSLVQRMQWPSLPSPYIYCQVGCALLIQSSSLGSLSQSWLDQFASSLSGLNPSQPSKATIHICYPRRATVEESTHGPQGGGTLFFSQAYWEKPDFPRHSIFDCKSVCKGSLMHSKIIIFSCSGAAKSTHIRFLAPNQSETADGYFYLGSHNHTQAAWGKFRARKPVLAMNNWELGIVLLFQWSDCEDDFRIPFEVPPSRYKEDDRPWSQSQG